MKPLALTERTGSHNAQTTMRQVQSSEWRIPGFTELHELGAGGQGRAVLVRDNVTGHPAVAKYVTIAGDETAKARFRQESVLLKGVESPYVARWYGHFDGPRVFRTAA